MPVLVDPNVHTLIVSELLSVCRLLMHDRKGLSNCCKFAEKFQVSLISLYPVDMKSMHSLPKNETFTDTFGTYL